jgi:hypothetical protein
VALELGRGAVALAISDELAHAPMLAPDIREVEL